MLLNNDINEDEDIRKCETIPVLIPLDHDLPLSVTDDDNAPAEE